MPRAFVSVCVCLAATLAAGAALGQGAMDSVSQGMANLAGAAPNPGPYSSLYPYGAQCFDPSRMSAVTATNERTVLIRVGKADYYRLKLAVDCPAVTELGAQVDLQHSNPMACRPGDVTLKVVSKTGAASLCKVASLSRMSLTQLKALPPSSR